ncbi:MAG: tryptophan 2,3-dioxygenase [Fluviicola sp.]|nr:MAG: tryptophan 2,3-dioxygenase [Fluviicola sp.]
MTKQELIAQIDKKYDDLGENSLNYLAGLLQAKPINYWDYIEVDTLLSLQKTRTDFKDEKIFIMYHQLTELVLGMMKHELEQLVYEDLKEGIWIDKINRLNRYTSMLITSFDVMKYGMNYNDYNTFRTTLTPASGFQSVQFRYIETMCTPLKNLVNVMRQKRLPEKPSTEDYFKHLYWKDAGYNRKTGKKTLTLQQFENKYEARLISLANEIKGKTLAEKLAKMSNPSNEIIKKFKTFDRLYNIDWPIVHLETAQHYLDQKGESKEATGGSEWKKYLHPKYQQRRFFPSIWSKEEIENWGK